eukprot:PhF_6_TR26126/c0_g1_i1/m.36985/K14402/CPSF2, CFT2; cleavage and polyadenylation specificity factor subunit 2
MEFKSLCANSQWHCGILSVPTSDVSRPFSVLLDCGWSDDFNTEFITVLREVAPMLDAIVISHGDFEHCGALPYLVQVLGVKCPIFATLPVRKFGEIACIDTFHNRCTENTELYTHRDIEDSFNPRRVTELDYDQIRELAPGFFVHPTRSGRTLGGSAWRFERRGFDEFLYCPSFSMRWDRHVKGIDVGIFKKSNFIVTDCDPIENDGAASFSGQERENQFLTKVIDTLRKDGKVLIPCDPGTRVTDVLLFLDQRWKEKGLSMYEIVLLTHCPEAYAETLKSMITYTHDTLREAIDTRNPLDLTKGHISLCSSLAQLQDNQPMIVLATPITLNGGFSQQLLQEWGPQSNNCIAFYHRPKPGTVAALVADKASVPLTLTIDSWYRVVERREDGKAEQAASEQIQDIAEEVVDAAPQTSTTEGAAQSHTILEPRKRCGKPYGEDIPEDFLSAWSRHDAEMPEDGSEQAIDDVENDIQVSFEDYVLKRHKTEVRIEASVFRTDFENGVDGGSWKHILQDLPHHKVQVFVYGSSQSISLQTEKWVQEERLPFIQVCSSAKSFSLAPKVDVCTVRLHPQLMRSQNIYSVSGDVIRGKREREDDKAVIDLVPSSRDHARNSSVVLIGDSSLSHLRNVFKTEGTESTEYYRGMLAVDDCALLRRDERNDLSFEIMLTPEMYARRLSVYR